MKAIVYLVVKMNVTTIQVIGQNRGEGIGVVKVVYLIHFGLY